MTQKYMLTIQHDNQKVAYVEFQAEDNDMAKIQADRIFQNYNNKTYFMPVYPMSGNFQGEKPRVLEHHVSKWIFSNMAQNAWGRSSGGYWSDI